MRVSFLLATDYWLLLSVDVEVVFEDDVLRDRAAVLLRRAELDLPGGFDGLLGQPVGQALDHADACHLTRSRQDGAQTHGAGDVVLARVLGEARLGLVGDDGALCHLVASVDTRGVMFDAGAARTAAAEARVVAADVVAVARPHPSAFSLPHASAGARAHAA